MAPRPRAARARDPSARPQALASQGLGLGGGLVQDLEGPRVAQPRGLARAGARAGNVRALAGAPPRAARLRSPQSSTRPAPARARAAASP